MEENRSEKKGNCTVTVVPFDVAMMRLEAHEKLRLIADEPALPVKAAIGRAARRVSHWLKTPMTDRRAEDIWRLEAKRIHAEEMDAIRAAAAERQRLKEAAQLDQIRDALTTAATRLRMVDEDLYGEEASVYERAARRLGGDDRPVARGD